MMQIKLPKENIGEIKILQIKLGKNQSNVNYIYSVRIE